MKHSGDPIYVGDTCIVCRYHTIIHYLCLFVMTGDNGGHKPSDLFVFWHHMFLYLCVFHPLQKLEAVVPVCKSQ